MGTPKVKGNMKHLKTSQEILSQSENNQPNKSPLDNEVILENIFVILKESNNAFCLGRYRTVCKFWDSEIAKLIRRETKINLCRILEPYPNGLGWNSENGTSFEYKVPYPDVHSFKNIVLDFEPDDSDSDREDESESDDDNECVINNKLTNILSDNMKPKMEKWFQLMGSDVRFLCITICSISTHYRILERILKEWCSNLEGLTLIGINLDALLLASGFTDADKNIICSRLKTLQIGENLGLFKCPTGYRPQPECYPDVGFDIDDLVKFIYDHGKPGSCAIFPEIVNSSGVKVVVSQMDIMKKSELPDLSNFFPETFFAHNHDGGILGQIIKCTQVEKLILHSLPLNLNQIVALFHYRPNQWRKSLKHLEFDGNKPLQSLESLIVLAKLKCPITTLKFPDLHCDHYNKMENEKMTRFLSCVSDSLENLSFSCEKVKWDADSGQLVLPLLPKLKTFVHKNIRLSNLSAAHLFESAQNLEKCYLEWQNESMRYSFLAKTFFLEKMLPKIS